ncbi:unnamed protein product [Euphydryas editha]|uniref:Uncharacterized protein n=1 Tax=Euphydryas editha TaxID=104508 RepID=A0AAU9UIB2_EUPED|nr:unnamed protein product [Euphydryas editha]
MAQNNVTNNVNVIFRSRYLEQRLKKIIDIVIQRNAYFAHPENILLAMLGDERQMIREKAVNLILQTRQENVSSAEVAEVRSFNVPPLNMNAKDYTEMIDWKKIEVTEPPLIKDLNEDDLRNIIENGLKSDILAYPCHNQSVERSIKLVTEASSKVCSSTSRDGFIRATLQSRKELPKFETKKDYEVKLRISEDNNNNIN